MPTVTVVASILCCGLAIVVAVANPRRPVNRSLAFGLLVKALWLACVACAMMQQEAYHMGEPNTLAFWLRANVAVASFIPLAVGLVSAAVSGPERRQRWRVLNIVFALSGFVAIGLTTLPSFLYEGANQRYARGASYYTLSVVNCAVYVGCFVSMLQQLPHVSGIRRLELKLVAFYSAGCGLTLSILNAVGNYLQIGALKHASIFVVFAALAVLGWTLVFRRVFDAREVALRLAQDGLVVALTALTLLAVWHLGADFGSIRFALVLLAAAPVALLLHRWSHAWLYGNTERRTEALRRRLVEAAATEYTPSAIRKVICDVLAGEFGVRSVTIASRDDNDQSSKPLCGLWARKDPPVLFELGWATPESLDRMRRTPAISELQDFLHQERASLIACVPRNSRTPSLVAQFGERRNEMPFTYPDVARLFGLLERVDNILTRSRLTEQAALQARMEHLAIMSRGLAHDLKNLITPVSSFLVHTDHTFEPNSPAAEVHAAARRSVRIMNDYVRESLFFSERLAPKFESVDVTHILETVREITTTHAQRRGVSLALHLEFPGRLVADAVLLQRMLANFVGNAIDASTPGKAVSLAAQPARPGWLRFRITDSGSGIAPEHLGRIFDAYFTTKEFGDDVRGFGLGLTISRKIADLHRGTIRVTSRIGEGTTMTVELPLTQPTPTADARRPAVNPDERAAAPV